MDANTVPSALQMLQNLAASIPALQDLVASLAYLIGLSFVGNALYKLRMIGDYRHMMSQPTDLKGPMGSLLIGVILLYLPSALDSVTYTLWNKAEGLMAYSPTTGTPEFEEIVNVMFQIIRFVGLVAFIRGWMILAKLGDHSNQGGIGKAVAHIFGGVMAYHIDATVYVVMATFGLA